MTTLAGLRRGPLCMALLCIAAPAWAQMPGCTVAMWETCDLVFELPANEAAGADLRAEFRSPRRDTVPIRAFADGQTLVLRFTPTEAGDWDYRLTSSIKRLDGQLGKVTATAAKGPGFVVPIQAHHFQTIGDLQPHLWAAGITHAAVTIRQGDDLRAAADRVREINARGVVADIALAWVPESRAERKRYLTDIVSRFAAFDIMWAGLPPFENRAGAAGVVRETMQTIARLDPYKHIRTTGAEVTSSPLLENRNPWMTVLTYGSVDPNVGAVEHEFYQTPAVNVGIRSRADLWNATMSGQYPGSGPEADLKVWFEFMKGARYWELEPYYDVDGGRALALPDAEYIVYLETPGRVEMVVENRGYKVEWMNPATGERIKAKDYKGVKFTGEPPAGAHDWVLHVYSDGRLESLSKTYKFESRRPPVQEIETKASEIPFEIVQPASELSARVSHFYELKINRNTKATQKLLVLWMAENVAGGEGARVVGTGVKGPLPLSPALTARAPAVLSVRAMILNAYGKAYLLDRAVGLTQ